jgi:hypothetical protein
MPTFDLTAHYSLLQAFDLIGRRIFGDDWTGSEAWTRRSDDPAVTMKERAAVGRELAEIEQQIAALGIQINYPENESQKAEAQAKYQELSDLRRTGEDRYRHFPVEYDTWIADHAAYARRSQVEDIIMGAFSSRELDLVFGAGQVLPWEDWRHRPGFKVYINLSLIRMPDRYISRHGIVQSDRDSTVSPSNPYREPGRYVAFVKAETFNDWLGKFAPNPDSPGSLAPEAQCRSMIKEMVLMNHNSVPKKEDCWQECKRRIPKLSERAFNRQWADLTPDDWKAGGRRPGQ